MFPDGFESRERTPARALLRAPLAAVGVGVGWAASLHRTLYRAGARRARRFPGHVVSVGSIVAGGTCKTPLAAWLASELRRRGRVVALASRGYGRSGREAVTVVSDGRFVHGRAETAGDEPMLLAAHAPGVPVLVGRDRGVVGLRALSAFGADVVVLDDGFQHHRLRRDLDIVTLDGAFGLGNGSVLPAGPLREPLAALRYADAVGVVDGPLEPVDRARVEAASPEAYRFRARRAPRALRPLAGGPGAPPDSLRGAEVGLLCGIARPASLRRTLEALGARVIAERRFRDHHRYRAADLEGLARQAPCWVTTEKDAGKLLPPWVGSADVRVLAIDLVVDEANALLDWIELRLR